MSTAHEWIEYYKIKKDSKSIKRVEELAVKRDEAVAKGDDSEVANIDSELTGMGDISCNAMIDPIMGVSYSSYIQKAKPFSEILNDGMKKQNDQFKDFVKNVGLGNLNDINIDYDIDK